MVIKMSEYKDKNENKAKIPSWMGNLPFPPDKKKPKVIRKEDVVNTVYGKGDKPIKVTVVADTNRLYFSDYSIKPGGWFEPPDIHAGDEVYYCLEGEATMFDPVHGDTFVLREGDGFLIPKGTWHVGYNFGDKPFRLLTIIAPKAWADLNVNFEGRQAFYKGEADT
jgi:mannose-6-phosphate isomerase-like protein (cupin superfamily)